MISVDVRWAAHREVNLSHKNLSQMTDVDKPLRHIKHPPPKLLKDVSNKPVIFISPKSHFIAALNRVTKYLDKLQHKRIKGRYVRVMGLGKAIDKTLNIGYSFQSKGFTVEVHTGTVAVLDEVEKDKDSDPTLSQRKVSNVEVRIFPKI